MVGKLICFKIYSMKMNNTKIFGRQGSIMQRVHWLVWCLVMCGAFSLNVAFAQTEKYTMGNVAIGGGGFVSGIITSKTEQGLMYARTDVGGAYRWDANNSKWIPLLDWTSEDELGYQGVESLAIDPVEPNKVYMLVGTSYFNNGKTAILRSSDYGNTFSITEVTSQFKAHGNGMGRQTGEKLVVDPNSNNILLCGTRYNGLFKSTDSGVSWSRLNGLNVTTTSNDDSSNGISFVVFDPSTGSTGSATQTIIAGVSRTGNNNLYRSDDGGATFTAVASSPSSSMPHRAVLASDGNLYITYASDNGPWNIAGAGKIYKYNLQSGTWTDVTPSYSASFGGISVDPNNANRIVTSTINKYDTQGKPGIWGDRIFLSTNGGASWTDIVNRGFSLDNNGVTWIDGNSIHWAGSVEFDPFDTKKVLVISGNGIFQNDNIDASGVWKFQVNGLEETVMLDMVSIPNGPTVSVIGDYDGFRHTDVTQYAPRHTPSIGTTTGIAYAPLNPNIMLRAGSKNVNNVQVGALFYSTDMGISWSECATTKGYKGKVAISADGSIFLHCPEESSVTYRSTDKGQTWTTVTGLSIKNARPVADPYNASRFYTYNANSGAVFVSTDGGATFTSAGSAGAGGSQLIRTAPYHEGDVWIPLNNGGLTRSTNSGQTFSKINNVTYCAAVGFGKEAPGKTYPAIYIWATVNGVRGIHRSIDEGSSWMRVNDDEHEYGGLANGQLVIGDMNVFGRFYQSSAGRGILYGESNETCIPWNIVPYIKVNTAAATQTAIASVKRGAAVLFTPQPISGGSWNWTGPNDFASTSREVTLADIQPAQSGIYIATYTDANGCKSAQQTFYITVSETDEEVTATEEAIDQRFGIYPNPVSSTLTIKNASTIRQVTFLDTQGHKIKSLPNNKSSLVISLDNVPAGIYIMELTDNKNVRYVKRVVKY